MRYVTKSGSYFEIRKVNEELYRIFYCWEDGFGVGYGKKKIREELVTSVGNERKARKLVKQYVKIYNRGYYDGSF